MRSIKKQSAYWIQTELCVAEFFTAHSVSTYRVTEWTFRQRSGHFGNGVDILGMENTHENDIWMDA